MAEPLDEDLLRAYRETHYKVATANPFVLHIGVTSAALRQLHAEHGVECSVFITAWNPYSEPQDPPHNAARQAELRAELLQSGMVWVDGIGEHPSGDWPGEDALLVLGVEQPMAQALGQRYGQNAVVWCPETGVPELLIVQQAAAP